jgi:hypothetical protein
MVKHLLVCAALVAVAGCRSSTVAAMTSPTSIATADTSPASALCALLAGRLGDWQGLSPFPAASAPTCLGTRAASGSRVVGGSSRVFHHHRGPDAQAWLFEYNGTVVLVDLFPALSLALGQAEAVLGVAPWRREVVFGQMHELPLSPPLKRYAGEAVYAARGLALLLATSEDGTVRIQRIRGFAPTDDPTYYQRFVKEAPVLWHDPE